MRAEEKFYGLIRSQSPQSYAGLNLGGVPGSGGGAGGPPGGFIGYLPQTRIAYDYSETVSGGTPASGYPTLLDNLNHIRYTISQLEAGGGVSVYENGVLVASGVTILDISGADVVDSGGGEVTISVSPVRQFTFTVEGALTVSDNPIRIYNCFGETLTITKVFLAVNTAPADASIIVDIHKDGTTIFTNQANRPQITSTNFTGNTTTIDVATWADGSYLQMDIDQIGSSVAGSDLSVYVVAN